VDRTHQDGTPEPHPLSDDATRVAHRLQELSVDQADRILRRAIELQVRAPGPDPAATLDTRMLEQIAEELDIDRTHVQQALLEELFRVNIAHPGPLDRLIVAAAITAHGAAPGSVAEVRRVVDTWMEAGEGMRKRAEDPSRTVWEQDKSFAAFARRVLRLSRGSQRLRSAAAITTSVRPATDDRQVVVVEADTSNMRLLALGLLAGAGVVGAAVAGVTGAVDPGGFGVDNVAAGVATVVGLGGGVLIGVKLWARRIRNALARAIDAIGSPHLIERTGSLPTSVRRLVDELWQGRATERSGIDRPGGDATPPGSHRDRAR